MARYFLGVDVGGTKTHALIADEAGRALGFGKAGPGNPDTVGYEGLAKALREATDQATAAAGVASDQIAGAGFGIAGYDWPAQRPSMLEATGCLGLVSPVEIVNDAMIGLLAGSAEGWGVAVVSGTSCNCWGRDRERRVGRVTGCGPAMAEGAGAHEMVARAIQIVALEWTRRGPATRLTEALVALTGTRDAADFLESVALQRVPLDSSAAHTIFQTAAEGDAVAQDLIRWAGHELGSLAVGVIRQLGFEPIEFDIVLVGSLYEASPLLFEAMHQTVIRVAPHARFVRLAAPPVVGGVLLAMEQAGISPGAVRAALIASTNSLIQGA